MIPGVFFRGVGHKSGLVCETVFLLLLRDILSLQSLRGVLLEVPLFSIFANFSFFLFLVLFLVLFSFWHGHG